MLESCRLTFASIATALLAACCLASVADAAPGALDRGFGSNGVVVTTPDAPRDTVLRDFIPAPGGTMLAVGGGLPRDNGVLIRYRADGQLDSSFGNDGIVLTPGSLWARASIQEDGKIVTFGRVGSEPAIARFDQTGIPDPTFGEGGQYVANEIRPLFTEPASTLEFIGPGIDSQGRILAATIPYACASRKAASSCLNLPVLRFTADGQPDPSFGEGSGHLLLHVGRNSNYRPGLIALAPDDSIVVRSVPQHRINYGGWVNEDYPGVLERFAPDGVRDKSFGTNGRFMYGHSESDEGKILFGPAGGMTVIHDGVLRINADGSPDPDFGTDGFANIMHSGGSSGINVASAASGGYLADGRLLIAGASDPRSKRFAYSIRVNADGERDPTYSNDGLGISAIGERMPMKIIDSRRGLSFAGSIINAKGDVVIAATGRFDGQFAFVLTRIRGGNSKQRLTCKGRPATIYGTPGRDRLDGGLDSVIAALGGDDEINGSGLVCAGAGDDRVNVSDKGTAYGGSGDDRITASEATVFGGSGGDLIRPRGGLTFAGTGDDRIRAEGGRIHAGSGDDRIWTVNSRAWGGSGDDRILDGSSYGRNVFRGGAGNDLIRGADGMDAIDGGSGRDRLKGGKAADKLFGRAGTDRLFGGPGSDLLVGGPGADHLDGGADGPSYQIYGAHNRLVRGQVKIIGNRVKATSVRVWLHCSGYTTRPVKSYFSDGWMFDELNFKPSGQFREDVDFYDGFGQNVDGWMKGRRTSQLISVRYRLADDFSYGEDGSYHCQTGKGGAHGFGRTIKFKLKRRPDQSQVVIQGGR